MHIDQKAKSKNQNQNKSVKLEVRYRAFYLSIEVIRFLETLPKQTTLKIIVDQLVRSITSIGANIVEAKASSSKREFMNYFQIALKSANEAKYWLAMLRELLPAHKEQFELFITEVDEIGKILGSSVLTMRGKTRL